MATAFSTPDQIQEAEPPTSTPAPLTEEEVEEVFEVRRCREWIEGEGHSRWVIVCQVVVVVKRAVMSHALVGVGG